MCSKIKHILLTACCLTGAGLMTSCNDGFMDRFPETSITEKVFFLFSCRFGNLYQWHVRIH